MDKTSRIRGGHVAEQLSAYLDDELSPALRGGVESHLASCGECSRELATLRATRTALREMAPLALPRSFILSPEMVAPRREERVSPVLAWLPRLRLATAAMAILLVVVLSADALDRPAAPANTFSTPFGKAPAAAATSTTAAAAAEMAPAAAEPTATTAAAAVMAPAPSNDGAGSAGDTSMDGTSAASGLQATLEPVTPAPELAAAPAPTEKTAMAALAAPTPTDSAADVARNGGIQAFAAASPTAAVPPDQRIYADTVTVNGSAQSPFVQTNYPPEQPVFLQWLWLEIPIGLALFGLIAVLVIFSRQRM